MHNTSFIFDYIMASALYVIAGMIILPTHISACSTLGYTTATRYSGTSRQSINTRYLQG